MPANVRSRYGLAVLLSLTLRANAEFLGRVLLLGNPVPVMIVPTVSALLVILSRYDTCKPL